MNRLMQTIVEIADKTFGSEEVQEDYVLAGQTNLMSFEELADLGKLKQLFEAFNHKHIIFSLLDQCLNAERMQIFIGQESGFDVLDMCSVVTAPYAVGGKALGVLGVIGPTRMAYERVIPIVEITAKLLASALNSRH
jgi:heat-inducible transcriptional repressor